MRAHTAQAAIGILTLATALFTSGNDACQKQHLRFSSVPVYHNIAASPCSCQESYGGATWLAKPRYTKESGVVHGTSTGAVMYNTKHGETGAWSTDTVCTWPQNDYGSKVTWGNGHQRTGAGETTYTFTAPATPITYSLMFKTHNLLVVADGSKVLDYVLVDGHVESTTHAGGYGISVFTWTLTAPLTSDPIDTRRAMYHKDPLDQTFKNGVFKRVTTENGPSDWTLEYVLPKP